jgi:hypothetical protein
MSGIKVDLIRLVEFVAGLRMNDVDVSAAATCQVSITCAISEDWS